MGFDITNYDIHALLPEAVPFDQHLVGLANSRTRPEVDLQLTKLLPADDREKVIRGRLQVRIFGSWHRVSSVYLIPLNPKTQGRKKSSARRSGKPPDRAGRPHHMRENLRFLFCTV